MVIGSNKCPTGYSCAAGAADEFFACCPTKPSPSPPPPSTLPGKSKPGSCPKPKPGTAGICLQRCNGDFDCPGNAKCCSNGCGNECSAPEDNDPKCRVGQPLSNVFCGRGPNRRDCPKGYYCNVHPTDKYAVCCRNDNVPICRVGQPLSNINCGRGLNRQNCPRGYYCNVHPTDKYAVCCRNVYMLPG
ncbi:uncharacterized protein LOC143066552 [Mytilus galloprovincialis]|uniref:uncharacterized protein LOC143066552 n=1 Tax=Mytilus galloprovincialis TaxID=29158 RepID=UPI003F7C5EDF